MSRIFISHSSRDGFEAVALRDWLAAEGWDDVFLDLDPDRGIAAGERWERALHAAANRCEAVAFLVSANWLASGWCRKEYELARGLNKKLFAVLIDSSKTVADLPPELTGVWQIVDLSKGQDLKLFATALPGSYNEKHVAFSQSGLLRLKRGLEKAGLDPKFFDWPPEREPNRAPYRGLKPLEAEDAGVFFGRDAPIVEATDRLRGLGTAAPPRLFVILGASGAGKSSFLRAGLLPRLARDDAHFVVLPPIRPGRAALNGESGLVAALAAVVSTRPRAELRTAAQAGATALKPVLAELVSAATRRLSPGGERERPPAIVVAVDQAEELFRAEGIEESEALLTLLGALAASDDPAVMVVFAIRSDSYDALERAKPLEGMWQVALPLLPMPRGAYAEVIAGPAWRLKLGGGKLAIEPRLTERLLVDVEAGGGSDALPLLAFTLEQLYLDYGAGGALRLADYEAFGGLKGAIDAAVQRAFARADANSAIPKDRDVRLRLLRRGLIPWLAGIDPDSKSPRRSIARRSDIPPEAAPLIDLLVEERLLSSDTRAERDPVTGEETRAATIEPTHEALLRQWGLLDGWLKEDFGLLATLEAVRRASGEWDANGRDAAWLAHRGQRLADADALDARPDIAAKLDTADRAYLTACSAKETAEAMEAEARRREREEAQARALSDTREIATANRRIAQRTRTGLVAALLLAAVATTVSGIALRLRGVAAEQALFATQQESVAKSSAEEARRNQAAALAALSRTALPRSPAAAAKLALAAWPRANSDSGPKLAVALATLGEAIAELRERKVLRGHGGPISSAAFSPDGARVVTASNDATARVWDSQTAQTIAVLEGHDADVCTAVFSPDGARVVTASWDNTARIWDAVSGKPIAVLKGHTDAVVNAVFSPNGARVATASNDGTARVWDAATGQQIALLEGHTNTVVSVEFSLDGARLVTASWDKTARIWDAATGQQIALLEGHTNTIVSAEFSPDGARVITASWDKTARVWNALTGNVVAVLEGHEDKVSSAAFSPDGTRVVTASWDKTARIWDAATGQAIAVLNGHLNWVNSAAFSPDGTRVVTGSHDRTARVWDAATGQTIEVFKGHDDDIKGAEFSPDGARVVTASWDETARIWDAATGQTIAVLKGHDAGVNSAEFSPDGARVVTGSDDNTARVWDAATGQLIAVLKGHDDEITSAAFSPDGVRVVTGSRDDTARIWDAATGGPIAVLKGHLSWVSSAVFSPDGARIVTASGDKTARVWDAATGQPIAVLKGHDDEVISAAFSPDGTRVVTGSRDNTARIWDAATGRTIAVLSGQTNALVAATMNAVVSAAFSPDGAHVVTASWDKTARIWDAATGQPVAVLNGHNGSVNSAAFSPNGALVVTGSDDKTARIWDAATGQPIVVLKGHDLAVNSAAFSPNGLRVVTASRDKTARIWDISGIPKGNIFRIACAWLPDRGLSDIARDYGLTNLAPICESDPPLPSPPAPSSPP